MQFLHRKSKTMQEADKALLRAQQAKEQIEARGPEVTEVSSALREIRERNHFVERLQRIIERREGTVNDT